MTVPELDFRWPSSAELDMDEFARKLAGSTSLEATIRLVHTYVDENGARLNIPKLRKRDVSAKSSKEAADWKKKGNDHFQKKRLQDALQCYSQVRVSISPFRIILKRRLKMSQLISTSPRNSEELAFGYANRSAALFHLDHHKEAVEDATRALESGEYPSTLR